MSDQVTKIYRLETLGYDKIDQELQDIATRFKEIKTAKQAAEAEAKKTAASTKVETEAIRKQAEELEKLKIKEQQLKIERQQLLNEAKALQIARQQEINQQRQVKAATDAAAGSYNALYKQYRELYNLVKAAPKGTDVAFGGQTLNYDAAIGKLKELALAEQDFRRQFARDGLLVGEYTSGIVQAFKQMGLDDLVGGQIEKANTRLGELDDEFKNLRKTLSDTGVTGAGNLDKIEKELIDNRKEAIALRQQVGALQEDFRSTGNVGNQITASLKKGFQDAKGQIAQLVIGYIGFRQLFNGLVNTVRINFDFEDTANQLRAITGVAGEQFEFLKQQALETSSRTKFSAIEILESFKLIASAKPELLENAEALNQVKDAAVLLAEAGGNDLPTAVKSLTQAMNQFNAPAEDAIKFVDALAAGAKFGAAEVPQITEAILQFGAQAKSTNVTIQESVGLIELLAEKGIVGAEAGTKLRNVLLTLSAAEGLGASALSELEQFNVDTKILTDNTLSLEDRLRELSKISGNATALVKVFGRENFAAGQIVLQNIDRYAQLASQVQAVGVAQEQATINTEGARQSWQKLGNVFQNFVTSRGVTVTLSAIAALLTLLLNNLVPIIGVLALFAIGWLAVSRNVIVAGQAITVTNAKMLLLNAQIIAGRLALLAYNGIMALVTITQRAYTLAVSLYTGVARAAAVATGLLGNAMRLLPLGLILTILGVLVATFRAFAASVSNTTDELRRMAIQQQIAVDISRRVNEATTDQISKMQSLSGVVRDNTISLESRKKALQELVALNPEYLRGLTLENIRTEEGIGILNRYVAALREKAAIEATQAVRSEKLQRDTKLALLQFDLEKRISTKTDTGLDELPDEIKEFIGDARKNFAFTASVTDIISGGSAAQEALARIKAERANIVQELDVTDEIIKKQFVKVAESTTQGVTAAVEVNISAIQDRLKELNDVINTFSGSRTELNKLLAERESVQKQLDSLLNKKGGGSAGGGSTNDPFSNQLNILEAQTKRLKAELELDRAKGVIDEEKYLRDLFTINDNYFAGKIGLYQKYKKKEQDAIKELVAERAKGEIESNDAILQLLQKGLDDRLKLEKAAIEERRDDVVNDPNASELQKAQARLDADIALLKIQEKYNDDADALEKEFNQASIENANSRAVSIKVINRDIAKDNIDVLKSQLDEIQQQYKDDIAATVKTFAEVRRELTETDIKEREKNRIQGIRDAAEDRSVLALEVKSLTEQLPIYKQLLEQKLITKEAYLKLETELNNKAAELNKKTDESLKNSAAELTGLAKVLRNLRIGNKGGLLGTDPQNEQSVKEALTGEIIAGSYALAKDAMNSYFDAEIQRIQQAKEANLQRLELEKEQLLARAQSKDEEISIEKQFQAKKEAEEKRAGERIKKVKKAEARIALASELANIAVAAAQNPLNGITLGAAGIAMYALLSGLALGRYALRVGDINRTQFEKGGQVPTKTGGKITGPSHAAGGVPFNYEAEGGELAIVRTKNVPAGRKYKIEGTHTQIASALNSVGGGRNFLAGAKVHRFEYGGSLGSSLQPPVFTPSYISGQDSLMPYLEAMDKQNEAIAEQGRAVAALASRMKDLKVYQVTSEVTAAQKKQVKQEEIGTL